MNSDDSNYQKSINPVDIDRDDRGEVKPTAEDLVQAMLGFGKDNAEMAMDWPYGNEPISFQAFCAAIHDVAERARRIAEERGGEG